MSLRQLLVNAAIDEIRRELGAEDVHQDGTHVSVDGRFKMARVLEAAFRTLYHQYPDALEAKVIAVISAGPSDEAAIRDRAADTLLTIFDYVLTELDPAS